MGVGHSLARKSLDHVHRARAAVDIVAQKNRHGMFEGPSFHIVLDALGHILEQVVTTMNIAHAINPSPIRDTTRGRNRGRFSKCLQQRVHPRHGFGGPHLFGNVGVQLIVTRLLAATLKSQSLFDLFRRHPSREQGLV